MASAREGPAETAPPLMCGTSETHGVVWSTAGQLGWLVTALKVALPFAAAAMPSNSAAGAAALVR